MKTTPYTELHIQLGAKMADFAGYNMPIEYQGINKEHMIVREGVGVFDVSHMGEFWCKGENVLEFLQTICSNDISRLEAGKAQYNCFPNGKGGIVDDLIVYKYSTTKYLLVVNAGNIDKDWAWVNEHNTFGVNLENASDRMAQLAIQGPKAVEVLQKLTDLDLKSIPYYSFREWSFAGCQPVLISNTGYTGAGGFELYFEPKDAMTIWNAIFECGKEYGIAPIGLGARDSLRLEAGYCLYGHDIDDTTSPLEAGLGWITKFPEGKNFIDRDRLWKQKTEGVSRRRVRFELQERGIPRQGYDICTADGENIGHVTSGIMLPNTKQGIGMGYVPVAYTAPDTEIFINIRGKLLKAKVVK